MGIRFSPGCECCGDILFWFTNKYFSGVQGFMGPVNNFYTELGFTVHADRGDNFGNPTGYNPITGSRDDVYSGDIGGYKLVFWVLPDSITPQWLQSTGNFLTSFVNNRLCIVGEYSYGNQNIGYWAQQDISWYDSTFAALLGGISFSAGVMHPYDQQLILDNVADPLLQNVTVLETDSACACSGGTVLAKGNFDGNVQPVVAHAVNRNIDFVALCDIGLLWGNVDPPNNEFLKNLINVPAT